MPTAAFANLGCKVNQYEIEKIAESFAARGFEVTDFSQPADVYVINTCSVTSAADRKSRQMARRAARQKPGAKVVLTGCFAQLALDTEEEVEGAALLVPNREKMRAAEHTLNSFPDLIHYTSSPASGSGSFSPRPELGEGPGVRALLPPTWREGGPGGLGSAIALFPEQAGIVPLASVGRSPGGENRTLARTRATLKVQDGCVHYCAFCSIPYTRNTMASRPLPAVIEEARQLAAQGTREVVVTGVCVGAYQDGPNKLADLLAAVAQVDGIERVRLSSIQPIETDDPLIETLAAHPALCPHLHLSLQSGDDTVLALMQRPYDTAYYRGLVRRLRERIPGIAITTDIIVGFPGETEACFENTLRFAEEMAFSRAHVFRYSPRQRTYAHERYADDVSPEEKERRHKALSAVCALSQAAFAGSHVGQTVQVLVEGRGMREGLVSGYTPTYVRVHFPGERSLIGRIVPVHIAGVTDDGEAIGESD